MMRLDPASRKETGYVALWVAIAILPVQAFFVLIKEWNYAVLSGSVMGSVTAVCNFALMCLMVQKAVTQSEKQAKSTIQLSQGLRLMAQGLVLVTAACLPMVFNIWATAIPLLVPRAAVTVRESLAARRGYPSDGSNDNESNLIDVDDILDDF